MNELLRIGGKKTERILKLTFEMSRPVDAAANWKFRFDNADHLIVELPHTRSALGYRNITFAHPLLDYLFLRSDGNNLWIVMRFPNRLPYPTLIESDSSRINVYIFQTEALKAAFISYRSAWLVKNFPVPNRSVDRGSETTTFAAKPSSPDSPPPSSASPPVARAPFYLQFPRVDATYSGYGWSRPIQYFDNGIAPFHGGGELRSEFRFRGKFAFSERVRALASLNIRHHTNPGKNAPHLKGELFEAQVAIQQDDWDINIGKQIIRWGKTDGVSPVDNVNPQDLNEFFLKEYEDRKLPVWMVQGKYYRGNMILETVFIPFFTPHRYRVVGSRWSLFGRIDPAIPDSTLPIIDSRKPPHSLKNSEFGLRVSNRISNLDAEVSYLSVHSRMPAFEIDLPPGMPLPALTSPSQVFEALYGINLALNGNLVVKQVFPRQHILGMALETTYRQLGIRGESALVLRQPFFSNDLTLHQYPYLQTIVGVDYLGASNLYVNLQYIREAIFGSPVNLLQKTGSGAFALQVDRGFRRDAVTLSMAAYYNYSYGGWYFSPEVHFRVTENLRTLIKSVLFIAGSDPFLSFYRQNDLLMVWVKYVF